MALRRSDSFDLTKDLFVLVAGPSWASDGNIWPSSVGLLHYIWSVNSFTRNSTWSGELLWAKSNLSTVEELDFIQMSHNSSMIQLNPDFSNPRFLKPPNNVNQKLFLSSQLFYVRFLELPGFSDWTFRFLSFEKLVFYCIFIIYCSMFHLPLIILVYVWLFLGNSFSVRLYWNSFPVH